MNVLDLDVYMDVLYIVCANYAGFVIPTVPVILFSTKKIKAQANLRWLKMGHCRLASIIYIDRASHRKLADRGGVLTYDAPTPPPTPEPS
jgi:hypothetical protein